MNIFVAGLALILSGGVISVAFRARAFVDFLFQLLVVAGCVTSGLEAIRVLMGGTVSSVVLHSFVPGGDWIIAVDPLSAVFLIAILGVGAVCAVFGVSYMADERGHRPVWFVHAVFAAMLIGLALVVTAQAIVPFLCAWEVMAIGSYLLIVVEDERPEVRRAGLIYIIATHTGTLALFGMFALWGVHATDWSFAALAAASPTLPARGTAVLALGLVGFGVKAGVVPFHFWLPPAHAAAPSHVSALLSGVVIKTGIYGLLRVTSMLPSTPTWWGWALLSLGAASGVLGVLWALAQHDIKRLLAYHSVENIGIILMGVGLGALGTSYGHPVVAAVGYAGALLHTINHALFKSLLFLVSGVVQHTTGTRNMEKLGGLAKRLPVTWAAFFVGAAAIVGLPPFNGFVSEWLVYQGLFRSGQTASVMRLAALGVPALALIGALALACFAKVAGVVFLGHARTRHAAEAREPNRAWLAPLWILATSCIALGVLAPVGAAPAIRVGSLVARAPLDAMVEASGLATDATWIGVVALAVFGLIAAGWLARRRTLRSHRVRVVETWACGYDSPDARMQYTASSFASPLLTAFGPASGVQEQRTPGSFASQPLDIVLDRLIEPLWGMVKRTALRARPLQQGRLHAYLLYVMSALLVLLAYLALQGRP